MGNLKKEPEKQEAMVVGKIEDVTPKGTTNPLPDLTTIQPVTPAVKTDIAPATDTSPGMGKDEYNVEVIVDYDGKIDPFFLAQKDPDYSYRYLRDDQKNLSIKTSNMLLQKGGWQLVPKEHLAKLGITDKYISPDGYYRVGDTILARMPKDLYIKKEEYKKKLADAPMSAIERMTKTGDASEGGKDIHDSMKGIQTKDQMGNVTWR